MEVENDACSNTVMQYSNLSCFLCGSMFYTSLEDVDESFNPLRILKGIFVQMQRNLGFDEERSKIIEILSQKNHNFCGLCSENLLEYDKIGQKMSDYQQKSTTYLRQKISDPGVLVNDQPIDLSKSLHRVERSSKLRKDKSQLSGFIQSNPCKTLVKLTEQTFATLRSNNVKAKEDLSRRIIQEVFPKCLLRFDQSNCSCIAKDCSIKINKIIVQDLLKYEHFMILSASGLPNHNDEADGNVNCPFCCKVLKEMVYDHLVNEVSYDCLECDRRFPDFALRNTQTLADNGAGTLSPQISTTEQKIHGVSREQDKKKKKIGKSLALNCKQCGLNFSNRRNLSDHEQAVHCKQEPKKKHLCTQCGKRFHKSNNLKCHILSHDTTKRFHCQVLGCKVMFKRQKALDSHMKIVHNREHTGFLCSVCGQKYSSFSGLQFHLAKHSGQTYISRNVKCDVCGKKFKCQSDLKIHSVVHTNVKGFSCDLCSQEFKQKASLKEHIAVHENLFQCLDCEKSFGRKRYLEQHQKTCQKILQTKGCNGEMKHSESEGLHSIVYQLDCPADESSQPTQCVIIQVDHSDLHLMNDAGSVVYIDQPTHSSIEVSQYEHESALAMLEFREQYRS